MLSDAEVEALLDALAGELVSMAQPVSGRIVSVHVAAGGQVVDGALVVMVQPSPPHSEPVPVYAAGVHQAEVATVAVQPGDVAEAGQPLLWVRDTEPSKEVRRALLDEAIGRLALACDHWQAAVETLRAIRAAVQDAADAQGLRRPVGRPASGRHHDALGRLGLAVTMLTSPGDCPLPGRLRCWVVEALQSLHEGLTAGTRAARHRGLEAFGRRAGAGRPRAEPRGAKDPVAVAAAVALLARAEGKTRAVQRVADAVLLDESEVWAACHEVDVVDPHALAALAEPALQKVNERKNSPFGPVPKLAEFFQVT